MYDKKDLVLAVLLSGRATVLAKLHVELPVSRPFLSAIRQIFEVVFHAARESHRVVSSGRTVNLRAATVNLHRCRENRSTLHLGFEVDLVSAAPAFGRLRGLLRGVARSIVVGVGDPNHQGGDDEESEERAGANAFHHDSLLLLRSTE